MKYVSFVSRWLLLLALLVAGRFAARAQNVGIGTTTPTQTLDVNGQLRVRGLTGTDTRLPVVLPDGTLGVNTPVYGTASGTLPFPTAGTGSVATGGNPTTVVVSGTTAYVTSNATSTLQIIGVANPAAPVLLGNSGSTDGTGAAARFWGPTGMAVDAAGTVYVGETVNNTIRKITPAGVVTTLAGLALSSGSTDGTGAAARFNGPWGMAVDAAGTVYVGDASNRTIRKVTPAGVVTTLAGLAGNNGSTDGTGAAARFQFPDGVAVDAAGMVYVADASGQTIRKITPAGAVTTLAGAAGSSGSADGTGAAARFNSPYGVVVDAAGAVYVGDAGNQTIRVIR